MLLSYVSSFPWLCMPLKLQCKLYKLMCLPCFHAFFFQWHLGFVKTDYTPTRRGFDTFFGYYSAKEDYWDHSNDEMYGWGLDLHNDTEVNLFIKN